MGFLFIDYNPVVHREPEVLVTQGLGEFALISAVCVLRIFFVWDDLKLHTLPNVADLHGALTEKVSEQLFLAYYYVIFTGHLEGIKANETPSTFSHACSMTCSDSLPSTLAHTSGPNLALAHLPPASATMAPSLKEFAFVLLLLLSCSTSSLDRLHLKAIGVTFSLVFQASIVIFLSSRLVLNNILLLAFLILCNFVQNVGGLLIRALNQDCKEFPISR